MARLPVHPGEVLSDELKELNMNGAQLAKILHIPANRVYAILAGKRSITADTALRISQWHGSDAEFWMTLQKSYDLLLAEQTAGEEIKQTICRRSDLVDAA